MNRVLAAVLLVFALAVPVSAANLAVATDAATYHFGDTVVVSYTDDSPPKQSTGELDVRCWQGSTLVYWTVDLSFLGNSGTRSFVLNSPSGQWTNLAPVIWNGGPATCSAEMVKLFFKSAVVTRVSVLVSASFTVD